MDRDTSPIEAVRPRVAVVSPAPGFLLSHRRGVLCEAVARGYDVTAIVPEESANAAIRELGVKVRTIRFARSTTNPAELIRSALQLRRAIEEVRPRVVHAIAVQAAFVSALALPASSANRLVVSLTGLGTLWTGAQAPRVRLVRRAIASVVCAPLFGLEKVLIFQNGDDEREFLGDSALRFRGRLARVAGSGVEIVRFQHSTVVTRDAIVFIGRTLRDKGVLDFIEVARRLRPTVGGRWLIAGAPDDGNPTSLSVSELEAAKARGDIDEWGFRSDIPDLLECARLMLFPSFREGFPKAVMEASAAGVPVVGYDVPGVRDAVRDEVSGVLVPFRDIDRLAAAAERVMVDDALHERLSAGARSVALSCFDERRLASATVDAYTVARTERVRPCEADSSVQ